MTRSQNNSYFWQHKDTHLAMTFAVFVPTSLVGFVPTYSSDHLKRITRLHMSSSPAVVNSNAAYQASAIAFLGGLRLPATLLAGTSIALLFCLVEPTKKSANELHPLQRFGLRIFHTTALLSTCLSLMTVLTTTVGSTLLLLGNYNAGESKDVYHFMRDNIFMEFVLSRWSFICSIILFLVTITTRIILEFDLWRPSRRSTGLSVLLLMTAFTTHFISYSNTTLNCWPNLILMTREVYQLIWQRVLDRKYPMATISFTSLVLSFMLVIKSTLPSSHKDNDGSDHKKQSDNIPAP